MDREIPYTTHQEQLDPVEQDIGLEAGVGSRIQRYQEGSKASDRKCIENDREVFRRNAEAT